MAFWRALAGTALLLFAFAALDDNAVFVAAYPNKYNCKGNTWVPGAKFGNMGIAKMGDGDGEGYSRCTIEVAMTYMDGIQNFTVTVNTVVTLAHKIRMIGEGTLEGATKDGKEDNCRYQKKRLSSQHTFSHLSLAKRQT